MYECQLVSTPIIIGSCLSNISNNGSAFFYHTLYHRVVEFLQHVTFTIYIVNKVCQFMHLPLEDH
jgi:hypothetical protein